MTNQPEHLDLRSHKRLVRIVVRGTKGPANLRSRAHKVPVSGPGAVTFAARRVVHRSPELVYHAPKGPPAASEDEN